MDPKNIPKPPVKSADEVQHEARKRSYAIHAAYRTLGDIAQRHEPTIQARWAKKSKQKRLKILLDAWPGMARSNRPDWEVALECSCSEIARRQGAEYRDGYMWPSINQDALLKPRSLLLMLHARARNHPSNFAAGDRNAMEFGIITIAILPAVVHGPDHHSRYVMILNGATDPEAYGRLVPCGDSRAQFDPSQGLLVLEVQERILNFLVAFCQSILGDIPPADLTCDLKFPVRPLPILKTEAETNGGFDSLAAMAAEAPYRLPALIDFARLELVLEAKATAACDHIWALREDPAYFVDCISDILEHKVEVLRDTNGKLHPSLAKGRESVFGSYVISDLLHDGIHQAHNFIELHRQAKGLRLLYAKHASHLSTADDLPRGSLRLLEAVRRATSASPPLRKFFVRTPPGRLSKEGFEAAGMRPASIGKLTKVECHFFSLLGSLLDHASVMLPFYGMPLLLDDLERLLQSETEAANLLSSRLANLLGDLSIMAQCLTQLDLFQPWARTFHSATMDKIDTLKRHWEAWNDPVRIPFNALTVEDFFPVAHLGDVSQKRFCYPADKRPTKENIEALRRAENNLDVFWKAIDLITLKKCNQFRDTAIGTVLSENRTLYRTPEWVGDSDHKLSPRRTRSKNWKAQLGTTEKIKIKTKGIFPGSTPPIEAATPETTPTELSPEQPTPPTVAVDAHALKVFRTLFFNPGATSSPGEVPWQDFVRAMTSTGQFTAEKLYGSAWQFQRRDGEGQASIQFHQPHPRSKIHFTMARRMGRRLNRTFGWTGSTFVLKENEKTT
ncbi:hypothetical protein B0T18DRAFT_480122 [Schizothecium vesticola]|uniref:Uncharacterized protein n=1 Tax=Schizothecium vesticola TaxID=314040 RepID=A0AA40K9L7_9PEZI|nr:hypothetical protein B0T18DRAFT_480122 [Schizothecium vesticola]